jgi:hypothetical protein
MGQVGQLQAVTVEVKSLTVLVVVACDLFVVAIHHQNRTNVEVYCALGNLAWKTPYMSVTDATFQPPMFWLNAELEAVLNIKFMVVTAATFHAAMSTFMETAPSKVLAMLAQRAVFQPPMFVLKAKAL